MEACKQKTTSINMPTTSYVQLTAKQCVVNNIATKVDYGIKFSRQQGLTCNYQSLASSDVEIRFSYTIMDNVDTFYRIESRILSRHLSNSVNNLRNYNHSTSKKKKNIRYKISSGFETTDKKKRFGIKYKRIPLLFGDNIIVQRRLTKCFLYFNFFFPYTVIIISVIAKSRITKFTKR